MESGHRTCCCEVRIDDDDIAVAATVVQPAAASAFDRVARRKSVNGDITKTA